MSMKMKASGGKLAVQTRLLTPPEAVTGVCLACQCPTVLHSLKLLIWFVQGVSAVVPASLANMGVCLGISLLVDISGFKVTHGSRVVEQTVASMSSMCGLQAGCCHLEKQPPSP
ncbi:hypothetical protein ILYODFUR_003924 [Ilyodon furcidens]|uniref:Uncharacterized protein n=1 Tax=Ilyodon furcidens TaxID=33524 RepID=A0ABV0T533_9TELE